jgi:hypothetical protein
VLRTKPVTAISASVASRRCGNGSGSSGMPTSTPTDADEMTYRH